MRLDCPPSKIYFARHAKDFCTSDILGVDYWKLLEMVLFIPLNTFWRVGKLYGFGKKFLEMLRLGFGQDLGSVTLRDALYNYN
jgi:hypothetical protein